MSQFEVLEVSFEMLRELRDVSRHLRSRSERLARQIEDAASSVALNLGEGRRRRGKDRMHLYRVAAGSADEVLCGLRVAEAWGFVSREQTASSLELLDRILAMLWVLTHGRGPAKVGS